MATKFNGLTARERAALNSLVSGGGILGPYSSSAALEVAYPAASNAGKQGLVGSAPPYLVYAVVSGAWAATGSSFGGGIPAITSQTPITLNTSATPSDGTFVAFASQACDSLTIVNDTGRWLDVQRGGAGSFLRLPPGSEYKALALTNANQIGLRLSDYATSTGAAAGAVAVTVTATATVGGETASAATIVTATASGASYVPFPSAPCTSLDLMNDSGVDINWRISGGTARSLRAFESIRIYGITNANQVSCRRTDSTTGAPATVYRAEALQ